MIAPTVEKASETDDRAAEYPASRGRVEAA